MSVAKHQACFTTKLQGQNLVTFSHSAVMLIAYLQHTVNTNKTCVNNALIIRPANIAKYEIVRFGSKNSKKW